MSVTFFDTGLVRSDAAALRADEFCVAEMLAKYRDKNNGDDPPGWPSQAAHKVLIEWSIVFLFSKAIKRYEHRLDVAALSEPDPWEGPSG